MLSVPRDHALALLGQNERGLETLTSARQPIDHSVEERAEDQTRRRAPKPARARPAA